MNPIIQSVKQNLDLSQNIPLKEALYQAFRKTIILGEIPAGARINEKEFSETLNISRTPIRFALRVLLEENLVEHIPKKGIIVKGISIKDAYEIFEIREALDTLATIKAMTLMTPDDYAEMAQLIEESKQLSAANDATAVLENFKQFNNLIYEKSQMLRLKEIVTELQTYFVHFRKFSVQSEDRRNKAIEEHELIYHAMLDHDIDKITQITHVHLNRSLTFILKEMERHHIE